jgi:hypothetical protein
MSHTIICRHNCNQPIYLALIHKANSYPPEKIYKAKAYRKAAQSVSELDYNLYCDNFNCDNIPYIGTSIKKFIIDYIREPINIYGGAIVMSDLSQPDIIAPESDEVNPSVYTRCGATFADYQAVSTIINYHFPDYSATFINKRIYYAFETNLWKYIINPKLYYKIYDDHDDYNSDVPEYCQMMNAVRSIIPNTDFDTIHRLIVNIFKNGDWIDMVYNIPYPAPP